MVGVHERIIAEHAFAKDLAARNVARLAEYAFDVRFEAGEVIFHEGERATHFYLITHGAIALEMYIPGHGPVPLATIEGGDVLGWSWLFPPHRWTYDARATRATTAVGFDANRLIAACEEDCALGYELMKRFARTIAQRLQATRMQLLDVYGSHSSPG